MSAATVPALAPVAEWAVQYVGNRWALVPIPPGEKGPTHKGWNLKENCITTAEDAKRLRGNVGLAHVYSSTCALDIDDLGEARKLCTDHGIDLDRYLTAANRVGIKSGKPGRAKLLFRVSFARVSAGFKSNDHDVLQFRCAASNGATMQDVLPPSVHPDTREPYTWDVEDLVSDWRTPPWLPAELARLWDELAGPAGSLVNRANLDPLETYMPPTEHTLEDARHYLGYLSSDMARGKWVDVAMALHHQFDGSDEARELFDEWSAKAPPDKYKDGETIEKLWDSIRTNPPARALTFRYIIKLATEAGAPPPPKPKQPAGNAGGEIGRIDVARLADWEPPPRDWLVRDWVPIGAVALLAGAGGVGKSLAVEQLAFAIAGGRPWLGLECAEGVAVGLFCEDDADELLRRAARICRWEGINPSEIAPRLYLDARAGRENALCTFGPDGTLTRAPLLNALRNLCESVRPSLVILDNAAQMFRGVENERSAVTSFCNELTGIAIDFCTAVVLLAHPAKAATSEYSGSTAWEAAVRVRLFLERTESGALTLRKAKSNYSPLDELPLEFAHGVLRRRTAADEAAGRAQAAERLLAALATYTGREMHTSHLATARNYLPKLAAADGCLDGIAPSVARDALGWLIETGRLRTGVELPWRDASRHRVTGLAECPATAGTEAPL